MIDENWLNEIFPNLKKAPSSKKKAKKNEFDEEPASVEEIFHTDASEPAPQEEVALPSEDEVVLEQEDSFPEEEAPSAVASEDDLISDDLGAKEDSYCEEEAIAAEPISQDSTEEIPQEENLSFLEEDEIQSEEETDEEEDEEFEEEESEEEEQYDAEEKEEAPLSASGAIYDWIKSFLISLTAVIFIFTLLFRGVTVSGDSMLPTLEDTEYLVISDLLYTPKTGDIVVVQAPQYKNGTEPLIKRIIATEGQTVRIHFKTWQVWVDDVLLNEEYVYFEGGSSMSSHDMKVDENGYAQITVEENCVFVMGDHRNDSLDSRSNTIGQVDVRYIMGRVVLRLLPVSKFGTVD